MAYRNGTYIAFHADGTNIPGTSDIDYYNLLKAWTAKQDDEFSLINSHDKASSVRDASKKATLQASLMQRLRNSKNMLLIIGDTTRFDTDWVPFEIAKAVDVYKLPVIAAYTAFSCILAPADLRPLWPCALLKRIDNNCANVIHLPFMKEPLKAAIDQFHPQNLPPGPLSYYEHSCYVNWKLAAAT